MNSLITLYGAHPTRILIILRSCSLATFDTVMHAVLAGPAINDPPPILKPLSIVPTAFFFPKLSVIAVMPVSHNAGRLLSRFHDTQSPHSTTLPDESTSPHLRFSWVPPYLHSSPPSSSTSRKCDPKPSSTLSSGPPAFYFSRHDTRPRPKRLIEPKSHVTKSTVERLLLMDAYINDP